MIVWGLVRPLGSLDLIFVRVYSTLQYILLGGAVVYCAHW